MSPRLNWQVRVDENGNLVLPPEAAEQFGLHPGALTRLQVDGHELRISRPISKLDRVYVEPTNVCNFDCRTCMRNVWDEPLGFMSLDTFSSIIEGISTVTARPMVFFGGYGEPLAHPLIIEMVRMASAAGSEVELITNGSLLTPDVTQGLQDAGLDRIWISLDGATPESYADIRLGEALPLILENLKSLWRIRGFMGWSRPRLGIAFVAMKRNILDLPNVIRLGKSFGADRYSISNVLAHTPELNEEVLYRKSMYENDMPVTEWGPLIDLPRMDISPETRDAVAGALQNWYHLSVSRQKIYFGAHICPFIQKGSMSVRWDGEVSPCLPLLHSHVSWLDNHERQSIAYTFGNIQRQALLDIWAGKPYLELRQRLQEFDFSPCVHCNSCDMAERNLEDCFGSPAPTCGGCLWAQGIIQCP